MLDYPSHDSLREYVSSLNALYLKTNALWELDFNKNGFSWIDADGAEKNTIAYRRISSDGKSVVIAINFSGAEQEISVVCKEEEYLKCVFETEQGSLQYKKVTLSDQTATAYKITISPFSGGIFEEISKKKKIKL